MVQRQRASNTQRTMLWYDLETFGAVPPSSRPAQFAAIRTTEELVSTGEQEVLYCRPDEDLVPAPAACLVTGLVPQDCRDGVPEPEFFRLINMMMLQGGTCSVGYNSIRFDDEFVRHGFWRNFIDPYGREWGDGRTRWDLLDVSRAMHAFRWQGVDWPVADDGRPSFKLEMLCAANGIEHEDAHDALSDVRATIDLARLYRGLQPKMFKYLFDLRHANEVMKVLDESSTGPVLHTSGRIPSELGCTSPVVVLSRHPSQKNKYIVMDLRHDPSEVLDLDAEELNDRLFSTRDELNAMGLERPPIKEIHLKRSPIVLPWSCMRIEGVDQRLQIDPGRVLEHWEKAQTNMKRLASMVTDAYSVGFPDHERDPETDLYGGFLQDTDRKLVARVPRTPPAELDSLAGEFLDGRLAELMFRYRARNHRETLSEDESRLWTRQVAERLCSKDRHGVSQLDRFRDELEHHRQSADEEGQQVLDSVEQWVADVCSRFTEQAGSDHTMPG